LPLSLPRFSLRFGTCRNCAAASEKLLPANKRKPMTVLVLISRVVVWVAAVVLLVLGIKWLFAGEIQSTTRAVLAISVATLYLQLTRNWGKGKIDQDRHRH
jgi:hypothetical protein